MKPPNVKAGTRRPAPPPGARKDERATRLHIGRLLDVADVPLYLDGPGLTAHTLIVGQSGSGKSFVLGRLLEEIAAKTRARIVILDPNSDFVKFSEVQQNTWTRHSAELDKSDTKAAFLKRWKSLRFNVLTTRSSSDLGLKHTHVEVESPTVSWEVKATLRAVTDLGFDTQSVVDEVFAVARALERPGAKQREPFREFFKRVEKLYQQGPEKEGVAEYQAIKKVYIRAREMLDLRIWATGTEQGSVHTCVRALFRQQSLRRVLCLDLASLEKQEQRLMVANFALEELWNGARQAWLDAMKEEPEADTRRPVFIVIDEAHNLAPGGAALGLAQTVRDTLARIATEGRKYGLFLLMVTQRPGRLDETIRSQCDNLCLLKMNDRHDLHLIEGLFGFIPEGWARRAMEFKQGDILIAGRLTRSPVYARTAPRRTAEGGRNLNAAWLDDAGA